MDRMAHQTEPRHGLRVDRMAHLPEPWHGLQDGDDGTSASHYGSSTFKYELLDGLTVSDFLPSRRRQF
jgi:hypothetical protein